MHIRTRLRLRALCEALTVLLCIAILTIMIREIINNNERAAIAARNKQLRRLR